MTAVDGDPLTGDPTGPEVRHLLRIIPAREISDDVMVGHSFGIPEIHEACGLGQCGGCSSKGCRTRRVTP